MKSYPISICLLLLIGITACSLFKQRPIELFEYWHMLGYRDPTAESVSYYIHCYKNMDPLMEDTVFYEFYSGAGFYGNVIQEIASIYTCYFPISRSGVLGLNMYPNHKLWNILPDSSKFPLYQYHINDSVISFHYMDYEEQLQDLRQQKYDGTIYNYYSGYTKWSCINIFDVVYKYLNGRDTLYNHLPDSMIPLHAMPMGYFPLDTNVYFRGQLVKKRLGYEITCPDDSIYSVRFQQADTFILSLPMKLFQKAYYETRELDCLDGKILPVKWP